MKQANMSYWQGKHVVVTGGAGFLGSHLCPRLEKAGARLFVPRSRDYDLRTELGTRSMLDDAGETDVLVHLAATCGGIALNREHPGLLFYENALMGVRLVEQARLHGVGKLVCVGTVCSYPRSSYRLREEALWDGYPDPTNAPYGLAKKMLLVQLQAYHREYGFESAYVLPTNLYGPGDNFDLQTSHVIPALVRKFVEAGREGRDEVTVWGTGDASRDFLYVGDAADGVMLAAEKLEEPTPVNLGSGREVRIAWLVDRVQKLTGFKGRVVWDRTKPDGQPHRVLDTSRAKSLLGWEAKMPILIGLERTITYFREKYPQ